MLSLFRKTLWLVADDPDGSWWCDCLTGIVDAPWHDRETHPAGGTGWLWTCVSCGRAFMFARGTYIRGTLEQLAAQQTPRVQTVIESADESSVRTLLATPADWIRVVAPIAAQIRRRERYVFFDGHVFPARHGPVKFDGLWRSHDLPDLPHLSDELIGQTLANPEYWVQP